MLEVKQKYENEINNLNMEILKAKSAQEDNKMSIALTEQFKSN